MERDYLPPRIAWPKYLPHLMTVRTGKRRDGEHHVLAAYLDDEWMALYYFVDRGGRLAISEVRIVPQPRHGLENRRVEEAIRHPARVRIATSPPNPNTGIGLAVGDDEPPHLNSEALRNVKAEEALKMAATVEEGPIRAALDSGALGVGQRAPRRHAASPYEVAVVAAHYVEVVQAGGRGNEGVAERLAGYDAPRVRRTVIRARSDDLEFLPPTKRGRQAGRNVKLTAKARRVLAYERPSDYAGPEPPDD
jgi:hypothetical protein